MREKSRRKKNRCGGSGRRGEGSTGMREKEEDEKAEQVGEREIRRRKNM